MLQLYIYMRHTLQKTWVFWLKNLIKITHPTQWLEILNKITQIYMNKFTHFFELRKSLLKKIE
jgi:formate-dependent nitrite reductase membrane component NrfD